jgi:uncharacterized surface protein with fasciclin (FAS1) repeats
VPAVYAQGDIVDVAVADGRFTTLVAAVQAAGLVDTLKGEGPFTVFAPTDDAFAKLPEGTVEALLADIPSLTNILLYHVVAGKVMAADVVSLDSANTALGKPVLITVEHGRVFVNDAEVVITDVEASNGVIHVVDTVLLPPTDYVVKGGDSLYHIAADLLGAGNRYREIVALTNAMHTLDASYPMIEHPDLIRVGWKLAIPGGGAKAAAAAEETLPTIVDIAVADGRFTTLVAALQAAGLVETLQGAGPFTVFAPTDDAFAKLPEGTVEGLLADIPALTDILLYHVVSGKVLAADVVELDSANTVLGKPVTIKVEGGAVMINESKVVITDIEASNGVIHVIDAVLIPPTEAEGMPQETIVDIAVADGRFTTLVAALQAAGLVETLQGAGPFTVFAPTDDAFAKLPEGTVEGLLANIPALTDILLYHVVSGKVLAADVVELDSANTVLGKPVTIKVEGGAVMINESKVVITDIEASNGVIHVIDAVLLPPTEYKVVAGDTLYKIAERLLGDGERYTEIVELTNEMHAMDSTYPMIENANLISVGWKLAIP